MIHTGLLTAAGVRLEVLLSRQQQVQGRSWALKGCVTLKISLCLSDSSFLNPKSQDIEFKSLGKHSFLEHTWKGLVGDRLSQPHEDWQGCPETWEVSAGWRRGSSWEELALTRFLALESPGLWHSLQMRLLLPGNEFLLGWRERTVLSRGAILR